MERKGLLSERKRSHKELTKDIRSFLDGFVDEKSFVENDAFYFSDGDNAGKSVICGRASIGGVFVYVIAQNAKVLNGGVGKSHIEKFSKAMDTALKAGLPVIYVLDSKGAFVAEGMNLLNGFATLIAKAELISKIVPTVCVIKGEAVGNLSVFASVCDFVYMTENGTSSLNSPSVVKAKEQAADDKNLFGGKFHSETTGFCDFAVTKKEFAAHIRNLISYLPYTKSSAKESLDEKELNKTVLRLEKADGSEFLNKICDKEFLEVGCGFAPECVTGFGKLGGISVGFVSQNGAISCKGLDKATRFVELCEKLEIPLVSVINSDGAEISLKTETSPVLTRISKLVKALSDTCLPKISLIKGKASGIAYTVFASKQLGFENVIAWDSAEISAVPAVTGGVAIYADEIANAADPVKAREEAIEKFRFSDADPYNSAILGLVDNVIEPKYTRVYLIAALQTFADIG